MSMIAMDMKLGLTVINEIIVANRGNQEVIDACKLVVSEFKKEIAKGTSDIEMKMEPTRLMALHRTKVMLQLLSDVNTYSGNPDEEYASKIGTIKNIVLEMINEEELNMEAQNGEGRK